MIKNKTQNITKHLNDILLGNGIAANRVLPLSYNELRSISSKYLNMEYRQHTLQPTELIHEAYLKLIGNQELSWQK